MFNFFDMADNYTDRLVENYKQGKLVVDTVRVTDAVKDYETAVQHPEYDNGSWVIVETYDTKAEAEVGHAKWVATMTAAELPSELVDVSSSGIGQLYHAVGGETVFTRTPVKE